MSREIDCYVKLNERLLPDSRASVYEAPLMDALAKNRLGEVSGGGTLLGKNGEIEYAGLDITLYNGLDDIKFVCDFLENLGAPKGSMLQYDEQSFAFGKIEGLGIYLDAINLPESVYESCDINVVWEELENSLNESGRITGYWEGLEHTALYLYGTSAQGMQDAILPFLITYPLCKGARIVRITPE